MEKREYNGCNVSVNFLTFPLITKHLETEEELKVAHRHLKEQEETVDKLRVNLSETENELCSLQKELETTNDELRKKVNWG